MVEGLNLRSANALHLWTAVGFGGIYCVLNIGGSMRPEGIAAAAGLGVIGVIMTLATLKKAHGGTLGESVDWYGRSLWENKRGAGSAAATVIATAAMLGPAAWLAAGRDSAVVGVVEGLRNAGYLVVLLYMWRLRLEWLLAVLAAWACMDIFVYWRLGGSVPPQLGSMTLVTSMVAGWAGLMVQELIDRRAARTETKAGRAAKGVE